MATPLSDAHRSWRIKIFAATWLSYVGFYFCRKPFSAAKHAIGKETGWEASDLSKIWFAYLIAYAIGQFLASQMGPRLGPRRNVLLGMALSVMVTVAMGVTLNIWVLAGLVAVNGLAQATGWSGNVGTMANWFHKHERGRVMGLWSTNFTIGALASGIVMGVVLDRADWRWCFYTGGIVLAVVWLQFYLVQRNRPEDVGLAPIDDPVTAVDESKLVDPPGLGLSRDAWTNLLLIAGFYFFAKFIRYAVWSWAAYFLTDNFGLDDSQANYYAPVFDLAGLPGIYLSGWISDKYFGSRRGEVALIMMCGMIVATGLLMTLGATSVPVFLVLLGAVGFTLFGPDALLSGAGAMDIGTRRTATFAAAMISGFGSTGAALQEIAIGQLYKPSRDGMLPIFLLLFGSAILGALFCAILVIRNKRGGRGI
jgi:OPA family glycerol-3-phosphate transporter-like MFS transporter